MDLKKYGVLYAELWKEYRKLRSKKMETEEEKGSCDDKEFRETGRKLEILYDLLFRKGDELNIFAQDEFEVVYNGAVHSIANNIEENIKEYLSKDYVYTVQKITPYDCYAIVELKEFAGVLFEASAFSNYRAGNKSIDELLSEYGPDLDKDVEWAKEVKGR